MVSEEGWRRDPDRGNTVQRIVWRQDGGVWCVLGTDEGITAAAGRVTGDLLIIKNIYNQN